MVPLKLSQEQRRAIVSPLENAIIAFRMGRGREEHYNDLAAGVLLLGEIIALVPRHRHLRSQASGAGSATDAILSRAKARTNPDDFWQAKPEEIDALEDGCTLYKAILSATPGTTVSRAIQRVTKAIKKK